ncbi:electron transfer protein with DM13 domain protein [Scytonema hofmannii PCC 7110]|uniref:Electron transfer protein with DM13 domain protein n=1 Tax=Scytonema hofmannii PCC 7110 TaxID=128403 RepID=A0A139WXR7_9CYAN|nr:DM13 domain-containing protein [Scytonema hofmannii]KYC37239.1 electron transfer protein with DM13 domain protein [Scytonema hofmannii PCC 7110]
MKLGYLLTMILAASVMVSCTKEISKNELTESSASANKSIPISMTQVKSQTATAISSGTFVSGEHTTQGKARITSKDGKSVLELEQSFKTSEMGPDLVVILHRSDNVIGSTKPPAYPLKKGDYIVLAPLKKFSGAQTYAIPNNINLANYKSVAIWCRKFNATFGAASLKS